MYLGVGVKNWALVTSHRLGWLLSKKKKEKKVLGMMVHNCNLSYWGWGGVLEIESSTKLGRVHASKRDWHDGLCL
jgi:hypothetical protein